MFNLILKDIVVQKKNLKDIILTVIFCMLIFQLLGETCIYVMIPYFLTNVFITNSCGYGEKNDVDKMFGSLPVSRIEMVFAKYLSVVIFLVLGIIITSIFTTIDELSGFTNINRLMNLGDIAIDCIFTAVYSSIYIPIYLCHGYLKSQWISRILNYFIFICLVVIILIFTFVENGTAKNTIIKFVFMTNFQLFVFTSGLSFSIIIALISICISLKLYINRDL